MQTLRQKLGVCLRPLAPQETDFEFLFLVVSFVAGASCFIWLAFGLPWPGCSFRQLTGLPCPTCGATRSALSLVHGDLAAAWQRNPLMVVCYAGALLLNLYCVGVLLFRLPRVRVGGVPSKVKCGLCLLMLVAIAANWAYLLANR
jgi:hypothetical protein